DQKTLFPNVVETIKAAEVLVREGFDVMVYTSDDPIIARQLADIGCVAVMPLAGLIGSGLGICNPYNLRIILEEATVPVLVDAGVGTASDATIAMELGCSGALINTAIAAAQKPVLRAEAMKHAVIAGRGAYLAGRMPRRPYAAASSPLVATYVGNDRRERNTAAPRRPPPAQPHTQPRDAGRSHDRRPAARRGKGLAAVRPRPGAGAAGSGCGLWPAGAAPSGKRFRHGPFPAGDGRGGAGAGFHRYR